MSCDLPRRTKYYHGRLEGELTCNQSEYFVLIAQLQLALDLQATHVEVRGDSKLVYHQVNGSWPLKARQLQCYLEEAQGLMKKFETFSILPMTREANQVVDTLTKMACGITRG